MSDYEDYDNLAFPPTTDETTSEWKEKYEILEYAHKELKVDCENLKRENKKLKQLLEFYWGDMYEYSLDEESDDEDGL